MHFEAFVLPCSKFVVNNPLHSKLSAKTASLYLHGFCQSSDSSEEQGEKIRPASFVTAEKTGFVLNLAQMGQGTETKINLIS